MKNHKKSLLFLGLLISIFFLGFFSASGVASSDINYNFEQETIYNYPLHQSTINYNLKNNELLNYTQTYNATYSFTNDISGENPSDWIVDEGGGTVIIINSFEGHDKVVEIDDDDGGNDVKMEQTFTAVPNASFEFWIASNNIISTHGFVINLAEGGTSITGIAINDDDLEYFDGGWIDIKTNFIIANTFFHIKLIFDDTANTFDVYINGILEKADNAYQNPSTIGLNKIQFDTDNGDILKIYLDAIGYSWDSNYNISNNIVPYHTNIPVDNEWEVDKWVFSFNDALDDQYAIGSDVFSDWTEIDGGGDKTNIVSDPLQASNRRIKLQHNAPAAQDLGIEREFSIKSGYVNISWAVEFDSWAGTNEFTTKIYSYDNTLIADIYFENAQLKSNSPSTTFITSLTLNVYYELNLFINYDSDQAVLKVLGDGVYIGTYTLSLITTGKDGLKKIESFIDKSVASDMVCYLDYIGVYVNGSSLSTELAFKRFQNLEWNAQTWIFNEHNLIYFDGYGDIVLWETGISWLIGVVDTNLLTNRYFVNDTTKVFNIYGHLHESTPSVETPSLFVQFFNELNISDITIEGVKLTDGSNKYPLEFFHGNVNIDESYFYVDSNNKLRGQCFYNDSNLEFIQANFDINNVLNENRSLRFRSQFSGQYGFFSSLFIDLTSDTINLPIKPSSHNIIMPQAKTIDDFIFLITDSDNLKAGYGSGYISDIQLIWNPSISITILTTSLIMVIIPIMILVIPTLALYSKFGKSVIMPVFIIMSIICFAGALIPTWVFFVLMLGAGGFLVLKQGSDK